MAILTTKIRVIWISRTFLSFVYQSKSTGNYKLIDKQKTKKVREIQITQILIVSITSISYIFCALVKKPTKGNGGYKGVILKCQKICQKNRSFATYLWARIARAEIYQKCQKVDAFSPSSIQVSLLLGEK